MALEDEIEKQKAKNRMAKVRNGTKRVYNLVKDYAEEQGVPKGTPTAICKRCKKEFQQDFVPDRNTYTDWKTCKSCRDIIREKKTAAKVRNEKEVSVARLPYTPYPWQVEAAKAFEEHRFIVLSCGNRCFLKGAFINGSDKLVENLDEEDLVIGENGNFQDIVQISIMPYDGYIYTVKGVGMEPIKLSELHPVWVTIIENGTKDIKKAEFVEVKDLQKYLENIPKNQTAYLRMSKIKDSVVCNSWELEQYKKNYPNQIKEIPLTEETAWMIGLYCAEGCYIGRGGCKWTLNYKEPELANKLYQIFESLNLHYNVREREKEGTRCVIVTKVQFCKKLDEEVGHGSKSKKIPRSILYNENKKILLSFLKGYYAGDGSFDKEGGILRSTTVSFLLSQQLQSAWTSLGVFSKITSQCRNRIRLKKDGTIGTSSKEYIVSLNEPRAMRLLGYDAVDKKNTYKSVCVKHKDAIYTPIKSVSAEKEKTEIYAITTDDGTIVANGMKLSNTGKDRFSIMTGIKYFVECLNENRLIDSPNMVPAVMWWIIAPIEPLARQIWRELRAYFPKEWIVAVSNASYQMETIGGGVIEVRSGYDPDMLVGVGLDLVTITEAARFKDLEFAWANLEGRLNSEGRGRKKDRGGMARGMGKAIINSSPLPGKNGFYHLYCYGQKESPTYSSYWWSCQYPWTANPSNKEAAKQKIHTKYGDITYEESLIRQMGKRLYNLNYLGKFDVAEGSVFKSFEEKCVINIYDADKTGAQTKKQIQEYIKTWQDPIVGDSYVIGYDPATGSSSDSPVFVVRHVNTGRIVRIFDLYGKGYEEQYNFIEKIAKQYNYAEVHWLRTGHTAIETQFSRRGLVEIPIDEQGQKKGQLVQTLEIAVENGDVHVLMDGSDEAKTLIFQMNDYTEKNGKYSNNEQPHDDFVSALYAAFSDYVAYEAPVSYCGLLGAI